MATKSKDSLLAMIRNGDEMTLCQQLRLTVVLSIPAILAQLSAIMMQYIDAAMIGSLGANESASIGLMATSTWLFEGICVAMATGFSVQVAHRIGASEYRDAQGVVRQSIIACLIFSLAMVATGCALSRPLPLWLGGQPEIIEGASIYFLIYSISLPALQFSMLGGSLLRCSGNMLFPGMVNIAMCLLNVVFNMLFIFPTRNVELLGFGITLPGAGWGVAGAAAGTALAEILCAATMISYLCLGNKDLNLRRSHGRWLPTRQTLRRAFRIGAPLGAEQMMRAGAHIVTTAIVAPLGPIAIAANAFAVTVESICYMPGYGVADAATTLVGQCIGAARKTLARQFARITIASGMTIMGLMAVLMYLFAPVMMGIISPVEAIQEAGVRVLRIEAFAEPMFAAAIVSYGVFVGAGDTFIPACMNLGSIWIVRVTLTFFLAPIFGLTGVWIAMAFELCFRGTIFLLRFRTNSWLHKLPATP